MTTEITIHGYVNDGPKGSRPRKPLIQILAADEYGNVSSICFHPDHVDRISRNLIEIARSIQSGRDRKPVKIQLTNGNRAEGE